MQKVYDEIRKYHMIETNDNVIVGVSGGADSLCLLFVLLDFRRQTEFELTAVHVEHGIRGQESLEDAAFVEELCQREHIAYHGVSCDVPALAEKKGLTMEEAARAARYQALEEVRRALGANKIAVAHNKNDQAETMLFRMARGSGLAGAGGIRAVRGTGAGDVFAGRGGQNDGVEKAACGRGTQKAAFADAARTDENAAPNLRGTIIRPLLCCTREEIEEYLTRRGAAWRTDSTNRDTAYARNYLRHEILPRLTENVNGQTTEHLAALADELQQVHDYMTAQARILLEGGQAPAGKRQQGLTIEAGRLAAQPQILQEYMIREALKSAGCGLKDITRAHIKAVRALCEAQSGRVVTLPAGFRARREFGKIVLENEGEPPQTLPQIYAVLLEDLPVRLRAGDAEYVFEEFENIGQTIPQNVYTKWFDYDKITNDVVLRTRQPGDYLVINGGGGRKKIKKYFMEEEIPQKEREHIMLLAQGSEIIWVVGHRISEAFKVTAKTKKILEVRRMRKDNGRED